jgi:hypothetical protein
MTTRRCMSKDHPADKDRFYDVALIHCPVCGTRRNPFNKWLRHAQMNSALNAQAQHAIETQ